MLTVLTYIIAFRVRIIIIMCVNSRVMRAEIARAVYNEIRLIIIIFFLCVKRTASSWKKKITNKQTDKRKVEIITLNKCKSTLKKNYEHLKTYEFCIYIYRKGGGRQRLCAVENILRRLFSHARLHVVRAIHEL